MELTMLILAAGLGRRYGGLKQIEPVGPHAESLIDYNVFDAVRAGFGRVVFVVGRDMESQFHATLGGRLAKVVPVDYAVQAVESLPPSFSPPPSRAKPWGTGHAVLTARGVVSGSFAVANADDFYGSSAIADLAAFLRAPCAGPTPCHAMIGYRLSDTLPADGSVSRAICRCTTEGWLEDIQEHLGLERQGGDARHADPSGRTRIISGEELVSMNLWGFDPAIFPLLEEEFRRFLEHHVSSDKAEFQLPTAVGALLRAGTMKVKVLPSRATWCGITHRQDRAAVAARIQNLVQQGEYPAELWA